MKGSWRTTNFGVNIKQWSRYCVVSTTMILCGIYNDDSSHDMIHRK